MTKKPKVSELVQPRLWIVIHWFEKRLQHRLAIASSLLIILLVAAFFRFSGLNWDSNQHLHPDERFLTMVVDNIQWPADLTWGQYFASATSPLSPYNHNFSFYVYGTLPIFLVKRVTLWLGQTQYDQITLVGRVLSSLFDLGAIGWLFLLGRRLYDDRVALLGAALLAMTVLPIQHAHFFTVDTFANLFAVATLYFAVRISQSGRWSDYIWLGLVLGAGLACKLSLFTLGGIAALAGALYFYRLWQAGANLFQLLEQIFVRLVVAALLAFLVFRVLQPIAFQGPSFFNFTLNPPWLANMDEIGQAMSGEADSPPGHQWTDRTPLWFPWKNMVVWGMGLPLGLAAWAGFALAAYELCRRRKLAHLIPVAYVALVFLHQGTQWVKSIRYFLPIYPCLALLAAYLCIWVWDWSTKSGQPTWAFPWRERVQSRQFAILLMTVVVGGTLWYALAFTAIYRQPHTRVQASTWIYNHIPAGTNLAIEHWDDGLPLSINTQIREQYQYVTLNNYDDDTPEKLAQLVDQLHTADYVILSSNRLYTSIPRLPLRYPMTTRYYALLFAEKLGFQKVAEFTAYPRLWGISLPDQGSDEAFTVYDHPKVTIFQKTAAFDADQVASLLGEGIDWAGVVRVTPKQATQAPTGLMLSTLDREIYTENGTWSTLFDPLSWGNQYPLLVWLLALMMMGVLAWPLTFVIFQRFVDRGYILSKAIALLWVGWITWWVASLHLSAFNLTAISVGAITLAAFSLLAAWVQRDALLDFLRTHWRLVLGEEALFWGLFCFFVWLRWQNPDLWHPDRGGEKPMDFAYLNAVVKSAYFPPYDPWFAGGFMNYYYFGFVLVATLVKLTGVVPAMAYNLAVPTFFAMTALGSFVVAFNLAAFNSAVFNRTQARRRFITPLVTGLLALLFVVIIGNLGQVSILWRAIGERSQINFETNVPGLLGLAKTVDGLSQVITHGFDVAARPERWYWDATRLIPHAENEAGPITEFPFFTFLFADLHAHMMALPYTLLVLALAANLVLPKPIRPFRKQETSPAPAEDEFPTVEDAALADQLPDAKPTLRARLTRLLDHPVVKGGLVGLHAVDWCEVLTLSLLALAVGALWPLNTWDFPTYATVAGLALACREVGRRQSLTLASVGAIAWRWGLVLGLGYLCFAPFHQHFAAAYTGFTWWQGTRTPLFTYLTIHGFFLFIILTYLFIELGQGEHPNALLRLLRLGFRRWLRLGRLIHLFRQLVQPLPWYALALRMIGALLLACLLFLALGYGVFALVLGLLLVVGLLVLRAQIEPQRQFLLGLIGLGLVLTLAVEIVVLEGDISRMNTVFKFYLQVWVIWAVAAAAYLPAIAAYLQRRLRWQRVWWSGFALLLSAALLYPVLATPARVRDRFSSVTEQTLDGTAYLAQAIYHDQNAEIHLDWERQAFDWLEQHVYGSPVIVEANTPLYRWGGRVANYTGLPAVIGWDWHQRQQRGLLPSTVVDQRLFDVQTIYTDPDPQTVYALLRRYNVQYIYVGPLERLYYDPAGLAKFGEVQLGYWHPVYTNEEVTIYQVLYGNE